MKRKARFPTALGDVEMDLKRAIIVMSTIEPFGNARDLWRDARDVVWKSLKNYVSWDMAGAGIVDHDLRAVASELQITRSDLEKIVFWSSDGYYPERLTCNCAYGRFWIAPIDPPPKSALTEEEPKVQIAEDLRANFRRRI